MLKTEKRKFTPDAPSPRGATVLVGTSVGLPPTYKSRWVASAAVERGSAGRMSDDQCATHVWPLLHGQYTEDGNLSEVW